MSDSFINQVTLDCLINKEMYNTHLTSKKNEKQNKEERRFYKKRTFNLFRQIISGNTPENLLPDVKYAYDNFINSTIHYFKTIDKNDIIQYEYKDDCFSLQPCNETPQLNQDILYSNLEVDKLLLRSVKINVSTLDKYVKRTKTKKQEDNIILPKQKEINLSDPEFKTKGLKKNNNINNIYEETKSKNETEDKK